ncbi:cytochrome P450 3A24-like [Babylonia areolata]|uniref:cytochrome P450 3A24-like n=1 Tax=Babylonia areolata TaxID=304850 RepID=UPI003FD3B7FA
MVLGLGFGVCCDWLSSLLVVGLLVLLIYVYGTWTYSTWTQAGVPGPKPSPFIGNLTEFRKMGGYKVSLHWSKKYGKTFGIYFMRNPMLLTTDTEILKEVFIKDFTSFPDRTIDNPLTPYPLNLGLVFVNGERWRRLRHTMTPTFSASKLKLMGRFINLCCENLATAIGKSADSGERMDVKQLFGAFTLDVIAGTGFGFETNSLTEGEDNVFLHHAKQVFGGSNPFRLVVVLAAMFPSLGPALRALGFSTNPKKDVNFLTDTIRAVIEERKRGEKGGQDFIQLMLDAEASDEEVARDPSKKHLTKDELIAQGLLLFVAGYDTTSTTLQFLSYLLATHPDVQDRLHREIVDAIGDAKPSYENVMSIPFLEGCIFETLRMYPPISLMARKAVRDTTVKGVKIPAGVAVAANIIGLNHDEEFFPEPDRFLPERYLDDQHPIPQLVKDFGFGAGPRQCLGMRLALYEAKMAVVAILTKFRFVTVKDTPAEIKLSPIGLTTPSHPVYIGAQRR